MRTNEHETAILLTDHDLNSHDDQRQEDITDLESYNSSPVPTGAEIANAEDVYDSLELGLFQTIAFALSKNQKLSVHVQIFVNILLSILDIVFDFILFFNLVYQDCDLCKTIAILIAVCDYLPGVMILIHDSSSSTWAERSKLDKAISVVLLIIQPFSVTVTNILFLFNISSPQRQHTSRLAGMFAGCTESPLQFILVTFMWSKGILSLPWQQATVIVDKDDNYLYLGNIGLVSLVFTTIGLLKAFLNIYEVPEGQR